MKITRIARRPSYERSELKCFPKLLFAWESLHISRIILPPGSMRRRTDPGVQVLSAL
jgi:hypothetical protein